MLLSSLFFLHLHQLLILLLCCQLGLCLHILLLLHSCLEYLGWFLILETPVLHYFLFIQHLLLPLLSKVRPIRSAHIRIKRVAFHRIHRLLIRLVLSLLPLNTLPPRVNLREPITLLPTHHQIIFLQSLISLFIILVIITIYIYFRDGVWSRTWGSISIEVLVVCLHHIIRCG